MLKKTYILLVSFLSVTVVNAQEVNYSPAYFGPNANPVAEFTNAKIPAQTTVQLTGDYFWGFGDNTVSTKMLVEIPLLSERISVKVWYTLYENYNVTEAISAERGMLFGNTKGIANGDFYVQTRILISNEKKILPTIILNSTLKTASGSRFYERRYFDTPGYYFDVEIGKSIHLKNKLLSEIRGVVDFGFLCWETTNSTQNDAFMHGEKMILSNKYVDFENSLSGYRGWMRNGDNPLVYSSKLLFKTNVIDYHLMYQYGITDFPYHHILAGISIRLQKLTPNYKQ